MSLYCAVQWKLTRIERCHNSVPRLHPCRQTRFILKHKQKNINRSFGVAGPSRGQTHAKRLNPRTWCLKSENKFPSLSHLPLQLPALNRLLQNGALFKTIWWNVSRSAILKFSWVCTCSWPVWMACLVFCEELARWIENLMCRCLVWLCSSAWPTDIHHLPSMDQLTSIINLQRPVLWMWDTFVLE